QYVHSRRLAGTVGAEEAINLTGRNREVDPVDCARPLLEFADKPARLDRVIGHRRRLATENNARAQVTSTAAALTVRPRRRAPRERTHVQLLAVTTGGSLPA